MVEILWWSGLRDPHGIDADACCCLNQNRKSQFVIDHFSGPVEQSVCCVCVCVCVSVEWSDVWRVGRNFFTRVSMPAVLAAIMSGKEMQAFYSTYSRIADLAQAIRPLKLTRGSGERCQRRCITPPAGSWAQPRPKSNLVHSRAVSKPPVEIILGILKCSEMCKAALDLRKFWHPITPSTAYAPVAGKVTAGSASQSIACFKGAVQSMMQFATPLPTLLNAEAGTGKDQWRKDLLRAHERSIRLPRSEANAGKQAVWVYFGR